MKRFLLLTLAAAACITGTLSSVAPGSQKAKRLGSAGVTIALPSGWHAMSLVMPTGLGVVSDPVARIVAASAPISFGSGCGQLAYSFPSTGVAVVVLEWTHATPGVFPRRPARFTAKTLPIHQAPAIECFNGPGGSTEFADNGRRLDAFILLGRHAPTALADRARAVLDTLRVLSRRTKPSTSSQPGLRNGTIAYKCGNDLCLMQPDGRGKRFLTRAAPSPQWDPAFSPDGRMLAFRGYYSPFAEGNYALYVSGTNGCGVRRVTDGATDPTWSPDGNWIAFDTAGAGEIWKIRRDGTGLTRIASATRTYGNASPAWSRDGRHIAFIRVVYGRSGRQQLWLMRPDGTQKTLLHKNALGGPGQAPAWSQNGQGIAFVTYVRQQSRIDAVDVDGSHLRQLTKGQTDAWNPVWLPHDSGIAFLAGLNGNGDLYVMRPDGKHAHKIAALATFEFSWANAPLPRRAC